MNIKQLLQLTIDSKASDLHLIVGTPPSLRIDGVLRPIQNTLVLTPDITMSLIKETVSAQDFERISVNKELDFSLSFSSAARFRVNAYTQRGSLAAAFRRIPLEIPTIDSLNLPKSLHSFITMNQGLILVTGPTGHGKSSTIAAMLNEINMTRALHIVTIEDPIEFIFKPLKSLISQREMKKDTHSWQIALRSVLREDPDVVLVGEMRDHETIASALTVAETGHLVFATLHTNSAAQTIDRIVDVFPEQQQGQVRLQLSNVIEVVFSQRLIPAISGGRMVGYEMMLGSNAIKTAVREGKTHQIDSILQTSSEIGMNTLENSLATLVKAGKVSLDVAQKYSLKPNELNRLLRGMSDS